MSGSADGAEAGVGEDDEGVRKGMAWPLLTLGLTLTAMVVPMALVYMWWQKREDGDISLDEILASESSNQKRQADDEEVEASGGEDDPLEAIRSLPWPHELPGLDKIIVYEEMKEKMLEKIEYDEVSSDMLSDEERMKLRHALMDRCQSHVVWLLRLEREQRSMDRMSRRGMVSAADFTAFSRFAELLDAEVNEVREEASWLSDDESRSRQAADEIWRIAVQIWQQRRQQSAQDQQLSQQEQIKEKEKLEGRKAKARAAQAKKSLKGLKGGFLDSKKNDISSATNTTTTANTNKSHHDNSTRTPQERSNTKNQTKKPTSSKQKFQTTQWPAHLPNARQREVYERMKREALGGVHSKSSNTNETTPALPENQVKFQLRQVLQERCQSLIPLLRALEAERERYRAAADRSRWGSQDEAPTAEDWGRLEQIGNLAANERRLVEEEADWLGDPDQKETNYGEIIWQKAFQTYNQQRGAAEKQKQNETQRVLQAYAAGNAKPWPSQLPGNKQRDEYERRKASFLNKLSPAAQAAVLQGRPAPQVIGAPATKELRTALMARCHQSVPLLLRFEFEARGVHMAAEKGHVPEDEYQNFSQLEQQVKHEIFAVKQEAAWLSGDKAIADQVWSLAIQIYNQRRAEIAQQLELKRQQASSSSSSSQQQPSASPQQQSTSPSKPVEVVD